MLERNLALRILIKILKVNYNIQWTHPVPAYTHTQRHKHNTGDMILLSILSNADESFGDNSDLDLLWEILNHLDGIKAQRQAEEMPQTDNETSVPTDSHEIDQVVGNP